MHRRIQSVPSWRQRCGSSLPCWTWRAFRSLCTASQSLLASLQMRCASLQVKSHDMHACGNEVKLIYILPLRQWQSRMPAMTGKTASPVSSSATAIAWAACWFACAGLRVPAGGCSAWRHIHRATTRRVHLIPQGSSRGCPGDIKCKQRAFPWACVFRNLFQRDSSLLMEQANAAPASQGDTLLLYAAL